MNRCINVIVVLLVLTHGIQAQTGKRRIIKLSHHINTSVSEYYPCLSPDGSRLYFTGMDRTGFFDYKIDYDKIRSAGGEDIFVSEWSNGLWKDARDIRGLNTEAHEAVTQILTNGDLLLTGNYPENIGPPDGDDNGSSTTDLFLARKTADGHHVIHFDEPVNSLFTEADGHMNASGNVILFVSDRPGRIGEHQKKGWKWNGSTWGNTDVWVSVKSGGYWGVPVNLGAKVNTPFAERSPWLSADGLTLYVSSNGYKAGKTDLDVYSFKRKDKADWTKWDGPFPVADVNSPTDDWCYRTYGDKAYFARSVKLGFTPSSRTRNGAGFVFETNFRPGYTVKGLQAGSFQLDEQSEIFMAVPGKQPAVSLSDILFEYNSDRISDSQKDMIDRLLDLISMNEPSSIIIEGHTDSQGSDEKNLILSRKRAERIRSILIENGFDASQITVNGYGEQRPVADNTTDKGRSANRRVELYFE